MSSHTTDSGCSSTYLTPLRKCKCLNCVKKRLTGRQHRAEDVKYMVDVYRCLITRCVNARELLVHMQDALGNPRTPREHATYMYAPKIIHLYLLYTRFLIHIRRCLTLLVCQTKRQTRIWSFVMTVFENHYINSSPLTMLFDHQLCSHQHIYS